MILLKNVFLDNQACDILIEQNKIAQIAEHINAPNAQVIDATGKAILPSFCNTHTHLAMMFLRGIGEDKNLFDWLQQDIFPREAKLKPEHIYALSRYGLLEMIKTGTTCFTDMYFYADETLKAVQDMGMRAIIPYLGMDFFDDNKTDEQIRQARTYLESPPSSPRIQKVLSCHSVYTCSEKLIRAFVALAKEYDTYLQVHVAETQKEVDDCLQKFGCRPVELLYRWGAMGPKTLFAHAVHLDDNDMRRVKETGTTLAHCPTSNLKLGSGQMPLQKYLDAGLKVTLGTDGVSSNNSLSMMSEMKLAALSAKNQADSVTAGKVDDIFALATRNGFNAFGLPAGQIKEGALADFILVDRNNVFLLPDNNRLSNMIYAADSSCITDVFCDGKAVMRNKVIPNEAEIIADFKHTCADLLK
ncbi:MAG: amidohydrolase [Alphaproteobacteria bacterium]|nr:amidohydrolase [Alphaproteobacteria bacterium]